MAAETTTGFEIDGTVYPIPLLLSFSIGEGQVLYDYTGFVIEDFVTDDDDELERMSRHPGFMRTMLHVAYQRGNPRVPSKAVRVLIEGLPALAAGRIVGEPEPEEDDAVPPALTSDPDESSLNGSLENASSSRPNTGTPGSGSSTGSETPDNEASTTGVSRLDTSSTSPPVSLAK